MIELTFPETRVLGCLIEKELTTPDIYPLSLNALVNACNQTTNRDPVTALDESTVQAALESLREKKLVTIVFGAGSRVQKYRHNFPDHYSLTRPELALLAVLLLRGAQTPGELRQRSERMAGVLTPLPEVEAMLQEMTVGAQPLIRAIPPALGRKEKRYVHLLSGEPDEETAFAPVQNPVVPLTPSVETVLREEITDLRSALAALREEFEAFRKQFEA